MASLRSLTRAVVLPIVIGFVALFIIAILHTKFSILNWSRFIVFSMLCVIGIASLVFGIELILGGKDSRVTLLFNSTKGFVCSLRLFKLCHIKNKMQ